MSDIPKITNPNLLSNKLDLPNIPFNTLSIINGGVSKNPENRTKTPLFKCKSAKNITSDLHQFYATYPLFAFDRNIIKIPYKVERSIRREIPKKLMKEIHKDIDVATELCLLFISQLTAHKLISSSSNDGWKNLKAEYLRELFTKNSSTYKNIISVLTTPLKEGAIIECDYDRIIGSKSYGFRIGRSYMSRGVKGYTLKTEYSIRLLRNRKLRLRKKAESNVIVNNLLQLYPRITLPTIDEIITEAKRLVQIPYVKKGKRLVFLNNHPKSYYKNHEKLSFVEDAISIFKYLTEDGYMFPVVGNESSGGRIVDSLTLMPSWIRKLIKIDGRSVVDCDYSSLHPCIALRLYDNSNRTVSHSEVGNFLNLDIDKVKTEHLSFFNKEVRQMKHSTLFHYYKTEFPDMLDNVILEKCQSEWRHKITSRKMFKKEVEIMTDVIDELNKLGIYVAYIYDAVVCQVNHSFIVKDVMDRVIKNHHINTSSKLSYRVNSLKPIHLLSGRVTSVEGKRCRA